MINRFKKFLFDNELNSNRPVLIGTSGGRDSMVLCLLYFQANIPFEIAHCNFNLRGEESDEDEVFVKKWAKEYKIPVHIKSLDTMGFADKNGLSIQMAARELRLQWFEDLCHEKGFEFYATAHHQDDAIETYLINQIRGTGLAGLHGILPKQGQLIHPLLFCSRQEITEYAQNQQLKWRDDSSNSGTKYLRNKVRHQLLPLLKEINPNIHSILQDNMNRLKAIEDIYQLKIQELQEELIQEKDGELVYNLEKLVNLPQNDLILFELIKEYGFNFTQASQILEEGDVKSGTIIESDLFLLLKNRNELILQKKQKTSAGIWRIEKGANSIQQPILLQFEYKNETSINHESNTGQFDFSKLQFPLFLRKWKEGDVFYPIGMKGKKKLLSDYFIDEKLSVFEKNQIWLLCSGNDIVWIIGKRMDDRFKINSKTTQILEVRWLP